MYRVWVLLISFFFIRHATSSVISEDVKVSLISFLAKLNGSMDQPDQSFGWNMSTNPCTQWKGVTCDGRLNVTVTKIVLSRSGLSGVFDVASLCNVFSLSFSLSYIVVDENSIYGNLPPDIVSCKGLTNLLLGQNHFSGEIPDTVSRLNNLKKLDISDNKFTGKIPDLSRISGLKVFLAQNNKLTGSISGFDFSNLDRFNVSFNNLTGPVPDLEDRFGESSLLGNSGLCGPPMSQSCQEGPPPSNSSSTIADKNQKSDSDQILMYAGYAILALVVVTVIICKISRRKKKSEERSDPASKKIVSVDDEDYESIQRRSIVSSGYKSGDYSINSNDQSGAVSTSLVVVTSPVVDGLKFEDLMKAPAELLGRGKHGSLYKVSLDNGIDVAVKRIKGWNISSDEFKQRMLRIYRANYPNVLPPLAFYISKHEKLVVYEFQRNGNLFRFIHGTHQGFVFRWRSRLDVAARVAQELALMHRELKEHGIAHGNLKSSNILFDDNMEACISEYGLMVMNSTNQDACSLTSLNSFKEDVYAFGVILLELLTGKLVQYDGMDITTWVRSVIHEEWTVEVFDKSLIAEGANEERMMSLLKVAIKCVNQDPDYRPSINQIASMIHYIKEEEEMSITFEP